MEWEEMQVKEQAFLDTIDILDIIKSQDFHDLDLLRYYIEDAYGDMYENEDFVFNYMDTYDFMLYLKKRYPDENVHFSEEESIQYVIY